MKKQSFGKITVNDICEEAIAGRATFYAHFEDKYSLLRFTLNSIKQELESQSQTGSDEELISLAIAHVYQNPKFYKNLLVDEGSEELSNMLSAMAAEDFRNRFAQQFPEQVLLHEDSDELLLQFCVGGMAKTLVWLIKNNFPIPEPFVLAQVIRIRDTTIAVTTL